jgi:hypothetical protein
MVHPFKLACAFRAAQKYISKSVADRDSPSFICIGLQRAARAGRIDFDTRIAAEAIVCKRIYPHYTVESWLVDQGLIPKEDRPAGTYNLVQDYRHRWLEELAREYFAAAPDMNAPRWSPRKSA